MSDTLDIRPRKPRSKGRTFLWAVLIGLALIMMFLIGGYLFLRSGAGLAFVEKQVEGRSFGPVREIEIDGMEGNLFDALTLDRIAILDQDGTWMVIEDAAVDYSLWSLRNNQIDIDTATAKTVTVLRRPTLDPFERPEGERLKVTVERFSADRLILEAPVLGDAVGQAVMTANGSFARRGDGSMTMALNAERLDSPGETLTANFTRAADGKMDGTFDLAAPAGGAIPALLRAPIDMPVAGTGRIDGSLDSGNGTLSFDFGDRTVMSADTNWDGQTLTVTGNAVPGAWPMMEMISDRVGDTVNIEASLIRSTRAFQANIDATDLTASASGTLPADSFVPKSADITLRSNAPQRLLTLPEGYRFARLNAEGRASVGDTMSEIGFDGDVSLSTIVTPFFDAGTIAAPVTLKRREDGTFDVSTTARLRDLITKQALPVDLAGEAIVKTGLRLNPERQTVTFNSFNLTSGSQSLTAEGSLSYGETPTYDLSGRADIALNAIGAVPPGRLTANYTATTVEGLALPAITTEGAFVPTGDIQAQLSQFIGERVAFDVAMQPIGGEVIRITDATIASTALRAVVAGTVGDTLNLKGEARLIDAITFNTATAGADSAASFEVTGPRTDPNLKLDATLPTLNASGQELTDVRLRADVSDLLTAPKGPVQVEAETAYGPLIASADLASRNGQLAASDIDVSLAGLNATGEVQAVGNSLYQGQLALNLPRDGDSYAKAILRLSPQNGEQGVALDADAKNISFAGYDIAFLEVDAQGTLAGLTGNIDLKGREDALIARQLVLDSPFTLSRDNGIYRAQFTPDASYGEIDITALSPVTATYGDGRLTFDAPLKIGPGTVDMDYARDGTAETLTATVEKIPLQMFPLPVGFGETNGTVSATANLASGPGQPPAGTINGTLSDWRGRLADKGDGLTLSLDGQLTPGQLNFALADSDNTEFDIRGEARIPLNSASTLTALRPNMTAPMSLSLDANGDARPVFSLFAPKDAEPAGQLSVDLDASGTLFNPRIGGTATGTGIRFEAPIAGTAIRKGRFRAEFAQGQLSIPELYAEDRKDGRFTGTGQFRIDGTSLVGELNAEATSFRALDRKDYEGRVDGTLNYVSTVEAGTITGDIKIDKAEVKDFITSGPRVVELVIDEVIGERENKDIVAPTKRPIPIKLDVAVRAPRKIFIRTRGIDLEAALDIKVKGTVSEPLIFGNAEVVRGGLTIASKELEFDKGGIVFNGPIPSSRISLEATAKTPTLTAQVTIKGTIDAPEIELSSTPERPQDEILSALLFGRSATQLSGLEAAQLAAALAQLSGRGGGLDLVGGLRDALGFSALDIGVDGDGNALLSGGRYLAKDVYLELFTGTDSSASGAVISWEVRPDIVLRTKLASDNEQAFALLYSRDF